MKTRTLTTVALGIVALTTLGTFLAIRQLNQPHQNEINQDEDSTYDEYEDYITYQADFGDGYTMYFDYHPGFAELRGMQMAGISSKSFGLGATMINATHVPYELNFDNSRPRTAEEYLEANADGFEFCDALPYENGDATGFAYWNRTDHGYSKAFTQGYQLFVDDEYFYIFVQSNKTWPSNIQNVRIVKN